MTLPTETISFGEFLPDLPDVRNPGLREAINVLARAQGYDPMNAPVATGQIVTGAVHGAKRYQLPDGITVLVVGTETDLFVIRAGSVAASGLALSLDVGDAWTFEQFGSSIYASCATHGLFRLPSVFADNAFILSPGAPPRAAAMGAVGDFLMLGNLTDIDASSAPYRLRWSAFNNPTDAWVTDIARQSSFVDMPARFGEVTGIAGGRFDLVFQRVGISRIWYSGGPTVFGKEVIEDDRGCPAPRSIVPVGGRLYFLAHDGFCRSDGSGVEVISSDRVWNWFTDNVQAGFMDQTEGVVDWSNRCIVWSFYPRTGAGLSRQLLYFWGVNRFTTASVALDAMVENVGSPVNIDEDDAAVIGDANLDADGPSFDSEQYASRGRVLAAFIDGNLHEFNGPALEATFETGDFQPKPGYRSYVSEVYPMAETAADSVRVQPGRRESLGGVRARGVEVAQGPLGFCPMASDARFHSLRFRVPAGETWRRASGYQVSYRATGR